MPRLAAPSWVWPGTVADNCRRLADDFDEIGLCLFETAACLGYGPDDLPGEIPGLSYHAHLPLDLPWAEGPGEVGRVVVELAGTIADLRPGHYVLHPPENLPDLAAAAKIMLKGGISPGSLLIENIRPNDLSGVLPVIRDMGLGVCLDLGHLLAYGQESLLDEPDIGELTGMLHLCVADERGRHVGLDRLDEAGRMILARMLHQCPNATLMLELFDAPQLFASKQWLEEFMSR